VLAAATASLRQIESDRRTEFQAEMEEYKAAEEAHELQVSAWKERSKQAYKGGKAAPVINHLKTSFSER
jgi:hypothetical protein